jgi:hypothetical protein
MTNTARKHKPKRAPLDTKTATAARNTKPPPRLTDEQWEQAAERVRLAAEHYSDFDLGDLTDRGVDEYLRARDSNATPVPLSSNGGVTYGAREATLMFADRILDRQTERGRLKGLVNTGAGFLIPLALGFAAYEAWHISVGWSALPRSTLWTGLGVMLLIGLGLVLAYVRDISLGRWWSRQSAAALIVSVAAATLFLPFMIRDSRTSERQVLNAVSSDVTRGLEELFIESSPGKIPSIGKLPLPDEGYKVTPNEGVGVRAVSFDVDARGLPGKVRAEFDSAESARVLWTRPVRDDVVQALIKRGLVQLDAAGRATLVTSSGKYPVRSEVSAAVLSTSSPVVGTIDPTSNTVVRLLTAHSPSSSEVEASRRATVPTNSSLPTLPSQRSVEKRPTP